MNVFLSMVISEPTSNGDLQVNKRYYWASLHRDCVCLSLNYRSCRRMLHRQADFPPSAIGRIMLLLLQEMSYLCSSSKKNARVRIHGGSRITFPLPWDTTPYDQASDAAPKRWGRIDQIHEPASKHMKKHFSEHHGAAGLGRPIIPGFFQVWMPFRSNILGQAKRLSTSKLLRELRNYS